MIYINLYVVLPRYLLKNKIWEFLFYSFLLLIANIVVFEIVNQTIFDAALGGKNQSISLLVSRNLVNLQRIAFFLGSAIGLKLFKVWLANQEKIKKLENINLKTELNYLKSQINPHFLFNTLNNIYVQTRIDQANASQTILKLSDLLRYQLYECSKDKVNLYSDIEYIKNYLELEKIRKTNANIEFTINGSPNGKLLSPFIFIPFVENAIKHGLNSGNGENYVRILMEITTDFIIFEVENSYNIQAPKVGEGGLGLGNVKRRLELLYPNKYELNIFDNGLIFKVILTINL